MTRYVVAILPKRPPSYTSEYAIHYFAREASLSPDFHCLYVSDRAPPFAGELEVELLLNYSSTRDKYFLSWNNLSNLYRLLRSRRPDILHVEQTLSFPIIRAIALVSSPDTRVILDIRTLPNLRIKTVYYQLLARLGVKAFAINDAVASTLGLRKYWLLPVGHDIPAKRFHRRAPPEERRAVRDVIYFGGITRNRRIRELVGIMDDVCDRHPHVRFELIGDGDDVARTDEFITGCRHRSRIVRRDAVGKTELLQRLSEADLSLSWIPDDAMHGPNVPLKTVESMAVGTPVLATNTEGNSTVVVHGRTGWLCSRNGYAGALDGLLREGYDSSMRDAATEAVEDLNWSALADTFLVPAYRELCER